MNKEHVQWVAIGVLVVAVALVGALVKVQNQQLRQIARAIDVVNLKLENAMVGAGGKLVLPEPAITASNRFIFGTHKVGDVIAGITVKSISPIQGINRPIAHDNLDVEFSGKKKLEATYIYTTDGEWGPLACFTPTNISDLPQIPAADASKGFCVQNMDKFTAEFGQSASGTAIVEIENFEINYAPAEVTNWANLVSVVSK